MQTYHPAGKDYGHMKINEPPTPYNYRTEGSDTECAEKLDVRQLAEKQTGKYFFFWRFKAHTSCSGRNEEGI